MSTEKKVLIGVLSGVALLALIILSSDVVEEEILPELKSVQIAIEVGDEGLARTGHVEIDSGTPFRLHAVVEATTITGRTIYYTDAERVEIDGHDIPSDDIRIWQRSNSPRILWFTVEGYTPYLELSTLEDLERFRFEEIFRPDWPRAWSIPGDLRPRVVRDLKSAPIERLTPFGTQRFHVRVEVFGPESEIVPRYRFQSFKASDLPSQWESFPTVSSTLPGLLAAPSRVFGLTQIEPTAEASREVLGELKEFHLHGLAFSRLTLLRELLDLVGSDIDHLDWQAIELGTETYWGEGGVSPGDLIRVGSRWVSVFEDRGIEGLVDGEDLCLDFFKGAKVTRLGEVFTGGGLVEWASLEAGAS